MARAANLSAGKTAAPAKAAAAKAAHRRGGWLPGLACGIVLTVATPAALLVAVLCLPSLLAHILDREPGRPMARNVLLFGVVLAIPALVALWHAGRGWDASLALITQFDRLAAAWAMQAAGWLLGETAPLVVRLCLDGAARAQMSRLRARRARYEAEWGLPPADAPPTPE